MLAKVYFLGRNWWDLVPFARRSHIPLGAVQTCPGVAQGVDRLAQTALGAHGEGWAFRLAEIANLTGAQPQWGFAATHDHSWSFASVSEDFWRGLSRP